VDNRADVAQPPRVIEVRGECVGQFEIGIDNLVIAGLTGRCFDWEKTRESTSTLATRAVLLW
jgi:hypothetical protein